MGSCAISGDFYRNLYSVVPGIDTFLPVDVYIPGCPPNPEALMAGLLRLKEKVQRARRGENPVPEPRPGDLTVTHPSIARLQDPERPPELSGAQVDSADRVTFDEASAERQLAPAPALEAVAAPASAPPSDLTALWQAMGVAEEPKEGPRLIPVERHLELATHLKALGYGQYLTVVATHWLAGFGRKGKDAAETEHFEVVTALRTIGKGSRVVSWSVRLAPGQAIPSLTGLYAGADWQEREQHDLVGVPFAGHPDPRRLMMSEGYVGHPLRRDFASDAHAPPWR
jgi:NADH:ubiquinone oxidoreductase subunit C